MAENDEIGGYLRGVLGGNERTSAASTVPKYVTQDMTYNSYSGADITAQMLIPCESDPLVLGDISTISYSIHRENRPVRFVGRVNVSGFVHGPRTIAGSLIFTNFDKYTFYRIQKWQASIQQGFFPLADMLPPFDIVLSFANEYGHFSKLRIYGCTIVDEGGTMSIDDLVTENTYTFMARGIQPMTRVDPLNPSPSYDEYTPSQMTNTPLENDELGGYLRGIIPVRPIQFGGF